MRTTASLVRGTYEITFDRTPAEPDVGIMGEGVEITAIVAEDGCAVEIDDVAAREGIAYDDAEAALVRACEGAAADDDGEPAYDLDAGFDPYAGAYTDDC